jgi:O-antigen/teichoic acid export membrane protein
MQADKVIYIFGGNKYKEAVIAVTIMAFYPIHQTYGQLSGSVFYATGQTGLYRNIGITFMLIGLPVTYFLIAPQGKMGLDIGATGLAIKMVSIQFVAVNVQLYFNTKLLKLSFSRFLGYQVLSVVCMISIAVCATFGVDKVLGLHENIIPSFLLAGVLYTVMVIGLVYCVPVVAGLHRQDIQSVIHLGVKKIWNR